VAGDVATAARVAVARSILETPPSQPWVVLDADTEPPDAESLGATLRGGVTPAITLRSGSLRAVLDRLTRPPTGLPEDAVRRLGVVLILGGIEPQGSRPLVTAAHYLRPTERDGQGHLQRRPPAVLATWVAAVERFEHFAWGITSELADRVDRSQDDFERRQLSRAALLVELARASETVARERLAAHLAAEPARRHALVREPAPPPGHGDRPGSTHLH
jgi:hypothetical protein